MTTITKEWLQQVVETDHVQCGDASAMAHMLLAGMQQEPVDNTFIPKNLDRALTVLGVSLPVSKEEFNFEIERWIQRLIDRVIRCDNELSTQPLTDAERAELQEYRKANVSPKFHTEAERFLPECLKPEEISGEKRNDRIAELMGWFDRYYLGNANPKWFKSHAAELCYYILSAPQLYGNAEHVGWIKCSEQMPRPGMKVLIFVMSSVNKFTCFGEIEEGGVWWDDRDEQLPVSWVTHWMPLPAAPQQEVG